jgi:FkbM family methyltransferase
MMSSAASPLLSNSFQAFSALVRAFPLEWKKSFFVWRSALLQRWKFDFTFYCAPVGLTWSAAGFPDMLTRTMLFQGVYQPEVVAALRGLIKPGDTVFDIGGHHGLMALVAAKAAGPSGKVITFEPNPGARELIRHHSLLNSMPALQIEPVALSDSAGRATFYVQKGDISWNSTLFLDFMEMEKRDYDRIEVETLALDRYVEQTGLIPQVIKLDAEGAEAVILRGARKTIERHRPGFTMEFNPESMAAAKSSVAEINGWLKSLGYRILVLKGSQQWGYSMAKSEPFEEQKHCPNTFCNVVCIPSSS